MATPTAPFPLNSNASWQAPGQPQQNLPLDNPPGINTFGFDTTQGRTFVPFWDVPLDALDPSNARLSPWDVMQLAGQTLPGICAVTGKRGKRFDVKRVKGQDFATITRQGFEPAELVVVQKIWTPQQLHALEVIMPILEAPTQIKTDGTLDAVDVYHPALAIRNIRSVLIKSIGILHPSDARGVWQQEIHLLEYKAVKKTQNATATANGSVNYAIAGVSGQSQALQAAPPAPPSTSAAFASAGGGLGN